VSASPYAVLEADPPWLFRDSLPGDGRGAEKHYRCLTVDEIKAFPLPPLAENAVLFLWRVAAMQDEALDVVRAWGFKPKSEIVWEKTTNRAGVTVDVVRAHELLAAAGLGHLHVTGRPHFGMGRTVRGSHETCIVAPRGRWEPKSHSVRSRFDAPVGRHSEKPERFYDLIEELAEGPYARLFARSHRPGWASFGNELPEAA
jgi:N6-adenosine-specific RNA methylase IME4